MTLPTSVFVLIRTDPQPEDVICLRWKKQDAEDLKKAQKLLYPSSTYEVVEWFVK